VKTFVSSLLTALIIFLGLTAFAQGSYPVTLQHASGEVTLEQEPVRVATLGLRSLEMLSALGVQPVAVATTNALETEAGGTVAAIPGYEDLKVENVIYLGTSETPLLEALTAANPDLILDEAPEDQARTELLAQIAPTVNHEYYTTSWQENLQDIAKLFLREDEAQTFIKDYETRVADLRSQLSVTPSTVSVIIVYEQNLILLDPANSIGSLVSELGFEVITPEGKVADEEGFIFLSLEALPTLTSDAVMLINRGGDAGTVKNAQTLLANFGDNLYTYSYPETLGINGPYSNLILLEDLVALMNE
jgi:iron complex transport system substrate-binding protein